ncbi:uncharacterized protein VDAG_10163 [Verticillium dahliae VdLs.17]|uniref:LDB19 N-terminal domain-containing protein n=2 Tax=Verticillium dahliae TaxID=27337 RepID=G2XJ31_VERDV|nr:uncharacterized protein VDAG_10163 [Verticillium dahliae VdLs.17]EGY20534.1 hypothetical protein VDAG_10163 [Verticillium dahliae VdLs.17]KAH6696283.1 hypothetical protein EV126DRAFT_344724 [Verticillium dahliae]
MPDLADLMSPLRSLSLTNLSRPRIASAVSLDWDIESSPNIVLGTGLNSPPSFLSGKLSLNIKGPPVEINRFTAVLNVHTVQKKPVKNYCAKCKDQYFAIHYWPFLNQSTVLQSGIQTFPFSTLIPDHLPASMKSPLLSVAFEFHAEVHYKSQTIPTSMPRTVSFKRTLTVRRHISIQHWPLQATRNFPASGIRVKSSIEPIIRPAGANNVCLLLTGLLVSPKNGDNDYIWRLWKGAWRLEETIKAIAIPCERHRCSVPESGSQDLVRRTSRTLGENGVYDAWKECDAEGSAEVEFGFDICQRSNVPEPAYNHDTKSIDGTEVTHALVIELVLVKEHFPRGQLHLAIRTGVGKILRLTYRVAMADDQSTAPGWVAERLPTYQDESPSPPGYLEGQNWARS